MTNPAVIGVVSFVVFFIVHVILWRLDLRGKGVFLITSLSALSYALVSVVYGLYAGVLWKEHAWVSLPLLMFLVMFYLHFYVGIDRSVSVRILGELVEGGGRLGIGELRSLYPMGHMFGHRLELLARAKWLTFRDGRYSCDFKGKYMALMAVYLKKLYSLDVTG